MWCIQPVLFLQELLLAVPPFKASGQGPEFTYADFQELLPSVDYFSIMTYDASTPHKPGPNAPWPWLKANIKAALPTKSNRYSQESSMCETS